MPKPCGHTETIPGCHPCWCAAYSRGHQELWGLPVTAPANPPPFRPVQGGRRPIVVLAPCPHRGDPTGETRPCPTCTGTVMVPLLQCALHDACTTNLLLPGVKCCRICDDRAAGAGRFPRPAG